MAQMHIALAHVLEEFADFLIGWVSRVPLDGWEPFSAGDHSTVIRTPAEQGLVILLQNKSKV